MAILQLGRFALLTRLLGLRAPYHCVKKAKRGDCKRTPKNARSVAHVPIAMARGAAFAEPCYCNPSIKNISRRAATSDRLRDNAMARMCGIELKAL